MTLEAGKRYTTPSLKRTRLRHAVFASGDQELLFYRRASSLEHVGVDRAVLGWKLLSGLDVDLFLGYGQRNGATNNIGLVIRGHANHFVSITCISSRETSSQSQLKRLTRRRCHCLGSVKGATNNIGLVNRGHANHFVSIMCISSRETSSQSQLKRLTRRRCHCLGSVVRPWCIHI